MNKTTLFLCGLALVGQTALANNVGIGYGASTELYKSDKTGYVLPMVDLEYDNFFLKGAAANGFSFGYNVYQDDFYTLSFYVKPFGGHEIDASDMKDGYKSIDDRKHKVMGGAELSVYTGFYDVEMVTAVDYGKEGGNLLFQLNRPYFVNSKLVVIPSVNFVYFNSDYVDYYFGVDQHEVHGNIKHSYEGDNAYTFGLNVTGSYKLTDNFSLMGFAGANRVSKEIKDSPIVDEDIVYFVGTGLIYTF